jgi:hypothetical protein
MTKKRRRDYQEEDYIDAWLEGQDHRYDPGYCRGQLPYTLREQKPSGTFVVCVGLFILSAVVARFFLDDIDVIGSVLWIVFGVGMSIVLTMSGVNLVRKKHGTRSRKEIRQQK